jgi:hypothetical protein
MNPRSRLLLGTLALAAFVAPPVSAGCAADYAPISQVTGLRVLAVVPRDDGSYVVPGADGEIPSGTTVTFDMTYENTYGGPVEIAWIGGCVNPAGDEYYGCYAQLGADGGAPDGGLALGPSSILGQGTSFTMPLPRDLISSRPSMSGLSRYGIAFAFFLACAGHLGPPSGLVTGNTGLAGNFPVGCYDDATNEAVGADRFVPGYTTVFAFADGYTNPNPPVCGLSVTVSGDTDGGAPLTGDGGTCMPDVPDAGLGAQVGSAAYCDVSEAARHASGCNGTDAFSACQSYDVSVEVPATVADYDPANGVYETVWVDYFADLGDIDPPVLLVAAAESPSAGPDGGYPPSPGVQAGKFVTHWVAPPPPDPDAGAGPETATIWAVVHDSRGGSTVVSHQIMLYAGDGGAPEGGGP